MNCDRIEELLPRFSEGDITESERAAVAGHLARCARCRDAQATFAALERLLAARRDESPPPRKIADAVIARLGTRRSRVPAAPRWTVPVLAAATAVAALVPLLARHGRLTGVVELIAGALHSIAALFAAMPNWIVEAAGGDLRIVLTVYLVLTAVLATAGKMICTRVVRE
jgi:anti-sigma factor RsiW